MTTRAAALAAFEADADLDAARVRLGAALPDHGWISDYLRAVVPLTDAPVEFSLASGLCAISAALGNSIWVDSWGQHVYPHLWAVLVAPSSFWRKSTAINLAERLLRDAEPERVLPSDFSREKLLEELQARPVGMLTLKEFGGFLATIGRDYMSGTKEMLTELYDGPDRYVRALKKTNYVVERPAITVLGATTLDWLESRITEGDLRGGFLGRFLFITATDKAHPKGLTGGMDGIARMHLRDGLRDLMKLTPDEAKFTPEGKQLLEAWIATWEQGVTATHHATDLTGFAVRLQTYAIKFAMLYQASHAVSVDVDDPIDRVGAPAVASAIAYCRLLWANVMGLVDDEIAIGRDAKELRRITGMVGGGITRSELLKLSKLKGRDFDEYLGTLEKSDVIDRRSALPAELGLERKTNRPIEWITLKGRGRRGAAVAPFDDLARSRSLPHHQAVHTNGSVPSEFTGTESELSRGTETGSESEPTGADLITDSSSVPSSLISLSRHEETGARTRKGKRGTENREPSGDAPSRTTSTTAEEDDRWG